MRGGVSAPHGVRLYWVASSPHAWGCFLDIRVNHYQGEVFPTCVGVFLPPGPGHPAKIRLPHMRGGVSKDTVQKFAEGLSSPHAWGCFPLKY